MKKTEPLLTPTPAEANLLPSLQTLVEGETALNQRKRVKDLLRSFELANLAYAIRGQDGLWRWHLTDRAKTLLRERR